jgi:hypothetical protein
VTKQNESNFYTPVDGVKKLIDKGFAFHVAQDTAYKIIFDKMTDKAICSLVEIKMIPPQNMMQIVQKGSPFREIFTYG